MLEDVPCVVKGCGREVTETMTSCLGGIVFLCGAHWAAWATSRHRAVAIELTKEGHDGVGVTREAWLQWLASEDKATASFLEISNVVQGGSGVGILSK